MSEANAAPSSSTRVSTFELFFDIVFVLTIARVSLVLHDQPDLAGLAAMFVILANIWWMYSGLAWLMSWSDTPSLGRRSLFFTAMGGFLVMALAVPQAFGRDGLLFGIAYLVVVLVHLALFSTAFGSVPRGAYLQVVPYNLGSAGLLIIAGFVEGPADWWLWTGAAALHVAQLEFGSLRGFPLQAARFVERHGIVLIVALSESMIALSLGVGDQELTPSLIVGAILILVLAAALWSLYFVDTDAISLRALEAAAPDRAVRLAGRAFTYGFVTILGGVLMVSAGLAEVLQGPTMVLSPSSAAVLACGAVVYLLGVTALRQAISAAGLMMWLGALAAAAVCAGAYWLGHTVAALAEVALLAAALFALTWFTHRMRPAAP